MGNCFATPNRIEDVNTSPSHVHSSKQRGGGDRGNHSRVPDDPPRRGSNASSVNFEELPEDYEVGALLKRIPLLSRLNEKERAKLGGVLTEKTFNDCEAMVKQGDIGEEFFIIKEGRAVVVHADNDSKEETEVATLDAGDYFGDTALLTKEKRGATVRSVGITNCYVLDSKTFRSLFGTRRLNIHLGKRKAISAEQFNPLAVQPVAGRRRDRDKSMETAKLIETAVRKNVLFSNLDKEQLTKIVAEMYKREVKEGETIITQGESGDNFYVVQSGKFEIFVTKEGLTNMVATRGPKTSFGELALMYNSPRAATVTAKTYAVVWAVDRFAFRKILMKVSEHKLKEYEAFLSKVPHLSTLLSNERAKIAEALEEVSFKDGTVVVKQGDEGDTFYIIRKGVAVVTKKEHPDEEAKEVKCLKAGDYFGERALMKKEVRAATVKVRGGPMECLTLDSQSFNLLLGPLKDCLERNVAGYETSTTGGISRNLGQSRFLDIDRESLEVVGTLGKGSFGHVQLVRDRGSKKTYALKSVSKAQVVQLGQQDHIMSEKRVMAKLDNPFLIKLWATYKTKDYLYFLLEAALGGELFSVLRTRTVFDEETSRFFSASVVLAFEYMHSKKIIYRDLKPENLLLDQNGYLKVTDFGFAKIVNDRTWTLCGTPDYLAPEVVSGQGHNKGVDWWTLGILIYEMLASYPPFYDEDPMKTYAKIMSGHVTYPKHFSRDAIDLISKLLHPKSTKRLGVINGGAQKIKEHPWFKTFSWSDLEQGTMRAPIIPTIKSDEDLSNFEEYPDEEDEFPPYEDDGSGWDDDF